MMILDVDPHPWRHSATLTPLHGRQPTTVLRPATYVSLFTRVLPLTTAASGLGTISGLRPLSCVIPTAFKCDFVNRFQFFGVQVATHSAWLHFACLRWGICRFHWSSVIRHHARASGCQNDVTGGGRHRVSSSRGADLYFGAVVVFCVFHLQLHFWGMFS